MLHNHTVFFDRSTGRLEKEAVYGETEINFLYNSLIGRLLTHAILKRKITSLFYSVFMKLPPSKKKILPFIETYRIKTDEFEKRASDFTTFNDFFIRKLKPHARPICDDPHAMISPADGKVLVYPTATMARIPVKGSAFTLQELVGHTRCDPGFQNGLCFIFRLTPADYHRFCYFDHGRHGKIEKINGAYHSVNPLALKNVASVFTQNRRDFTLLFTEHFGDVMEIDVGALLIGKIIQHHRTGTAFVKGTEKGYFEFGGSTIILLFKENAVFPDNDIRQNSENGYETSVLLGSRIGAAMPCR